MFVRNVPSPLLMTWYVLPDVWWTKTRSAPFFPSTLPTLSVAARLRSQAKHNAMTSIIM